MLSALEELIIEILENYGYRVISVSNRIIRAERNAEDIVVSYALPDENIEEAVRKCISDVRKISASTKLFINLTPSQTLSPDTIEFLKEYSLIHVPRLNFEMEIGRTKLSKILEGYEGEVKAVPKEITYSGVERFFAINVDRNAIEKLSTQVSGFNYELRYVPHHLFSYVCEIKRPGIVQKLTGFLTVDAINGQIKKWKTVPDHVDRPEIPGMLKEPVLGREEAEHMAKKWILANESREIKPRELRIDNILVIEKRLEAPDPNTISLNYLGIFHLPIWYVEGSMGIIIVNASDGAIIDMEFF
ncbi:MAG: hypothetical protein ACPL1Y_03070 [Thermoplasmata archaeon]